MKTLLLLRHAKSSWDNDHLADHARPLNGRGRHDAPLMGKLLDKMDVVPDLIISSTAKRAAATAEKVARASSFDGEIRFSDDLYLADPETYIELAQGTDDAIATLMMVGHNPGIEELVEQLVGHNERMPTAALACIHLAIDSWREINLEKTHELAGIWRPKEI